VIGLFVEGWGKEEVAAGLKDTVDCCVGAGDVVVAETV